MANICNFFLHRLQGICKPVFSIVKIACLTPTRRAIYRPTVQIFMDRPVLGTLFYQNSAAVKRRSPGHVKRRSHAKSWRFPGSPHLARQLVGLVAAHCFSTSACLVANRCQCIINYIIVIDNKRVDQNPSGSEPEWIRTRVDQKPEWTNFVKLAFA